MIESNVLLRRPKHFDMNTRSQSFVQIKAISCRVIRVFRNRCYYIFVFEEDITCTAVAVARLTAMVRLSKPPINLLLQYTTGFRFFTPSREPWDKKRLPKRLNALLTPRRIKKILSSVHRD